MTQRLELVRVDAYCLRAGAVGLHDPGEDPWSLHKHECWYENYGREGDRIVITPDGDEIGRWCEDEWPHRLTADVWTVNFKPLSFGVCGAREENTSYLEYNHDAAPIDTFIDYYDQIRAIAEHLRGTPDNVSVSFLTAWGVDLSIVENDDFTEYELLGYVEVGTPDNPLALAIKPVPQKEARP